MFNKFNSPLESFIIYSGAKNLFSNLLFDLTFYSFYIILFFVVISTLSLSVKKNAFVFNVVKNGFNNIFLLFKTLITSLRLQRFFSFMFSVLILIFFLNLAGFFLTEISLTSHATITLFLSFVIFFTFTITSLLTNGKEFYNHFFIKNLSVILTIVLFLIELVSYFVRPFSLGIRLFANILSGHILIHIFFGAFLFVYKIFFWISMLLLFLVLFVMTMEIFVTCVQSYIFFILSLIYLQDVFIKH